MATSLYRDIGLIYLACVSLLLFGCGGGSGGSSPPASTTVSVSGTVFAGPASGASVTVKTLAGTVVAGPVATGSDGSYGIALPLSALSSDLIFEASGGTYDDEAEQAAAGSGVTLATLSAYVPIGTIGAGANMTLDPATTIIHKLVAGGMAKPVADATFKSAFGFTPDTSVKPAFARMSSACTVKQRLAGVRAAAFSQLTKDLGLAPAKQFELIDALAEDLSDGLLDGKKAGGAVVVTASGTVIPEDIANRFVQALVTFQTSALNRSRLTADQVGTLPFNKTALTASYKVEYLPGAAPAAQGKSTFRLKLTARSNGAVASGRSVTILPYMHMATKSHSTPFDAVIDNGDGTYTCTVYYLMSTMMNGIAMGFWELRVTIDGTETTVFYPTVGMATGVRATLRGVTDSISVGGMAEKRAYNIFFDGLAAGTGGTYTFNVFVSAKESMVSWPGVSLGTQLHDQTGAAWAVTAMTVQLSTDGVTWVSAVDAGNGHWSAPGLTGLSPGVSGTVYLKTTINGEQKTTDGNAVSGTNGAAVFTVVP